MIKFKQLLEQLNNSEFSFETILTEEIHPEIHSIMNSEMPVRHKLNAVTKKVRELANQGIDSGIEDGKPKKGSSRAVLFSSQPEMVKIDGVEHPLHTATKIAFPGNLDKYTGHHSLLGEEQNRVENDWRIQNHYAILSPHEDGGFQTNVHGVVFPILDKHEDSHWLKTIKMDKFSVKDLPNHTKNEEFPKGISLKDFQDTLNYHYENANGRARYSQEDHDKFAKLSEHPYVDSAISMMFDSGMHPGDLQSRNWKTFVHPATGKRIPCIIDYGYTKQIGDLYNKARKKKYSRY